MTMLITIAVILTGCHGRLASDAHRRTSAARRSAERRPGGGDGRYWEIMVGQLRLINNGQ